MHLELYRASCMASLLNNLILVSFKAAWTLYFPWYTIYHWSKHRQLSTIILKSSKTDISREGHRLVVACSPSPLCPVSAMRSYFLSACPRGPLFSFQSGRYLTRSAVIHLLRDAARYAGLHYKLLKGHSFRIGAASTAAAAGLPDWLIKVLGRWSSDCYQLCIRTPKNVLMSAAPRMASVLVS